MNQAAPDLRFSRFAAVSVGCTATLVALGSTLSCWRTGRHGLHEAIVAAIAALTPMLTAGWVAAVAASGTDRLAAGQIFVGTRLTALRFAMALGLLVIGHETIGVRGGSPILWFVFLYGMLLAIEVRWLTRGLRTPTTRGEGRA